MTPDHLSYSALSAYQKCPRAYQLGRILRAPEVPAWYFATGTAVHRFVEDHLKGEAHKDTVEFYFLEEVEKYMEIEPDTRKWAHAGSKEDPVIEEKALRLAQECAERAIALLDDIDVWEVELDVTGMLPGCPLPVMGFVDIVGEHKKHGPIIGDWKTGKSKPKDALQLETYGALMRGGTGVHYSQDFKGLWLMVNPGAPKAPRPIVLKETPVTMGNAYGDMARSLAKGGFPARVKQWECNHCHQQPNCIMGGKPTERSKYYEKLRKESE
jgi:RecB family exonuclease